MRKIILTLLVIGIIIPTNAQRRKNKKATQQPKVIIEETPTERLFKSMLPATAKVMFIDSTVIDKKDFIKKIPLHNESGDIQYAKDILPFLKSNQTTIFLNKFGGRYYYTEGDTISGYRLYTIDKKQNKWVAPQLISEIDTTYSHINFPILLADGITLLFAAQGEHSLGGYDIFMTLMDTDSGQFYKPENYGLPFNSTANDYMVAFDEFNEWGWLVSDRYQPEDKVCIYTFVPTTTRVSINESELTTQQLTSYAQLNCIKDTWAFGNYEEAILRYKGSKNKQENKQEQDINFAINDKIVYHSISDFKTKESLQQYFQLVEIKTDIDKLRHDIDQARADYKISDNSKKEKLKIQLLDMEAQFIAQQKDIQLLEKSIRNKENTILKND